MLTNTAITSWLKHTGSDRHGQAVLETQSGGPWGVAAEPCVKKLVVGTREVATRLSVIGRGLPEIVTGDYVVIGGETYWVVGTETMPGTTMAHRILLLS